MVGRVLFFLFSSGPEMKAAEIQRVVPARKVKVAKNGKIGVFSSSP